MFKFASANYLIHTLKYSYSPPVFGIMHPSSEYDKAPKIEYTPHATHMINADPIEPTSLITPLK